MRKKFWWSAACVGMMLALAGCGTTVTFSHSGQPSASASNAGLHVVNGTASANGVATEVAGADTLGQQSAPPYVQLSSANSALGTIVTNTGGRTLYRFDKDSPHPSTTACTGACTTTWPPVIVQPGGKVYLNGPASSAIGTLTRPEGTLQLTIGGWPIYTFSGDHAQGQTNGQGVNGTWFAVAPTGAKAAGGTVSATTTTSADQNPTPSSTPSGSSTPNAALTAQQTSLGLVVANGAGKTVYVNSTDKTNPSAVACTGNCSAGFMPVLASNAAIAITGVPPADIGTVTGAGGVQQLTLVGFPLYTSTNDAAPGQTNGTSTKGWFVIALNSKS